MATNTYLPVVGGLERSIQSFADKFRQWGHDVLIIVPDMEAGEEGQETGVLRIPAIHVEKPSEFFVPLPFFGPFANPARSFHPDVIHAHHPFWMGEMALKLATQDRKPLIFTYHILFDQYAHYLPIPLVLAKRFLIEFAVGFANLSTSVIAPSESVKEILEAEGVKTEINVIPTGIELAAFAEGDGKKSRKQLGIPQHAFVVGYAGRLAAEKNLAFLARAVSRFMKEHGQVHFLVIGEGFAEKVIQNIFSEANVSARLHLPGLVEGPALADGYHAMDVFAFASKSETQGMVLCEAMAAGIPVVALDAPGVREVVQDFENGRLLLSEDETAFESALNWYLGQDAPSRERVKENARKTAELFSLDRCARQTLKVYEAAQAGYLAPGTREQDEWHRIVSNFKTDWKIMANFGRATGLALKEMSHMTSSRTNHAPTTL